MKEDKTPPSDFNGASYALWLETHQTATPPNKLSNLIVFAIFILGIGGLLSYLAFRALF